MPINSNIKTPIHNGPTPPPLNGNSNLYTAASSNNVIISTGNSITYTDPVYSKDHPTDNIPEEELNARPYRHLNLSKKSNFKLCEVGQLYYIIDNVQYLNNKGLSSSFGYGSSSSTFSMPKIVPKKSIPSKEDVCILNSIKEEPNDLFPIVYSLEFYNFTTNKKITIFVGDNTNILKGEEMFSVFKINMNYETKEGEDLILSKDKLKKIKSLLE
jgi:hypothetical protein